MMTKNHIVLPKMTSTDFLDKSKYIVYIGRLPVPTAENITAGGIYDDKESNDGDGHVVIVIVILAAIFVVIAIVALIKRHKIRKHFKCLKADHAGDIEMENRDNLLERGGTTEQFLPGNATNNDNILDSGGATEQPLLESATNNADLTGDIEIDNRDNLLERGGTTEQFLPENATNNDNILDSGGATEQPLLESATNNDNLLERGGTTEQFLPENATNNDNILDSGGATEQPLLESATNNGLPISGEKTPDPSIPEKQNAPKTDIQRMAVLKTKISTTKKDDNILLQIQVNNLLNTIKNPTESWTKDDLVQTVDDLLNKLCERKAIDLLKDFGKAINEDENIKKTLRICQKEICKIFDSLEKKYNADIKVSKGCVCFTFHFHTNNDLDSFLVKVQEGQEELRKDISDFLLNKTLMDVFHVDSMYVNLVISKVTANKGSALVYQKDFLKSTTDEDDMTAGGNVEDVILKKDISKSHKIELESKFDSFLLSMKNPESMQKKDLKTLVEDIVYEVIANKRIDLLTQFATAYEQGEFKNALHQHGANMHRTLIPIFEDVNLIWDIFRKGPLMITEKDKDAYDEAVANRFRSSQISLYLGYKVCNTRALSFSTAATWMISKKQEFAKFGFFYKGTDLNTVCFHCGCLKDGWTEEDDILATHLSLTESCAYANYMISALPLPF